MKFKINYDDQPNEVVDKISSELRKYGLTIREIDSDDGYIDYEIIELLEAF